MKPNRWYEISVGSLTYRVCSYWLRKHFWPIAGEMEKRFVLNRIRRARNANT